MRDRIVLATCRTWPEPSSSDRALADAERDPSLQCARARALEPRKELSHRARRPRRSGPRLGHRGGRRRPRRRRARPHGAGRDAPGAGERFAEALVGRLRAA